jgi:hypothetical protein
MGKVRKIAFISLVVVIAFYMFALGYIIIGLLK